MYPKLSTLKLINNGIENIETAAFNNMPALIYLDLSRNHLKSLPSKMFEEEINLVDNRIKDIEPNTFVENVKLKRVHLNFNPLSDLKPDTFRSDTWRIANTYVSFRTPSATILELNLKLWRLKILNLQTNEISEFESNDIFQDNLRLERLFLSYNKIRDLPLGIFHPLRNLQFLSLHQNKITDLPPGLFKRNTKLKHLHLSYNDISELNTEVFKYLKHLHCLNLEGNALKSVPKDIFVYLTELKELFLSGNRITYIEPGSFNNLILLKTLMLYQNKLKQLEPNVFFKLIELSKLGLSSNGITDIQYGTFNSFHDGYADESSRILDLNLSGKIFEGEDCSVERLHLHGNKLTFFDKGFLKRSCLKFIRIGFNPWQCSCLNEIMNDVHQLNIEFYSVAYFDGTNPVCVVTMNDTCTRETYLAEDLLKQYKSVDHDTVFRAVEWN
ncbi:leucine-rich repeat-containing protein 15-like [Chrysoperla carnea]|uniref:leucine-rich repeat-containing protein 15-like n=1 Tax=Chrysoperla carnea TaxID=189513 RepID=UPI001D071FCB|nr:leucine-rich repeat-containing protein 15-like [Chrysoperla carnea]